MKRLVITAAAAWAVACSPVDGGFGEGGTELRGRVVRADGQGVEGLRVHVRGAAGVERVATSGPRGAFELRDPPIGAVQLIGHDGRGGGLLVDAALIEGGQNDVGELRLRPLAELPSMVTVSGLGLEERVTNLAGDCLYPIFSADHARAYCLRTVGDSALAYVVEIDVTTGAERVFGADEPLEVERVCSRAPLRLEGDHAVLGAFADQTLAFALAGDARLRRRNRVAGACESSLDAIADSQLLHWLDYGSDVDLRAERLESASTQPRPRTVEVPDSEDRYGNAHVVVAVSPTQLAIRLHLHDPQLGPSEATTHAIHVFDLLARTVTVAHPSYPVTAGAFVNGELRVLGPAGISAFDAQGVERTILATDVGTIRLWASARGSAVGVAAVLPDEQSRLRLWRADLAAGTLTAYPSVLPIEGAPEEELYPYQLAGFRGWRDLGGGDIALTAALVRSATDAPGRAALAECILRADGTGRIRWFRETRDDGVSGPISRVMSPDGSRTALLTVDPATGFRQVSEGPASELFQPQRTFIAGSHTALDYSADGSALHFFAFDPLSGYIQLFRLATTESAPPP